MWKPKPIKGKDEDFLQPRRSITLAEFLPRSFLEDHSEEIVEVTACQAASIVEVDNNYGSSKEVDNSNKNKQRTSVFDRIKPSNTRSLVFQRLSMTMKEEENQCQMSTYTRTSAFKKLSISTSKKDQPSTFAFNCLKMTNNQQQRQMKSLKVKPFHEENNDDEIHSHVSSRMKRKLSVVINTKGATSPLLENVDQRTLLLSDMLQTRIFPCVATKRIFIFIFSYVLWSGGSTSSSSQTCYNQEHRLHFLTCVATKAINIFIFMWRKQSSSSVKAIIFNTTRCKQSLSSRWHSRDDHHLHF
ncbi:hypothetical protein E5676_scaffold1274G00410 [Cucumis melo var. makuwa]|uniref:Uncharacterized protein n=1 Tax=Cucumis melo var. makuwa TaxID=1194695 RepID=A0A5D3D7Q8_CUCMM|nr:hypothetical protein E5676_scaffold1274G00410 [Cucumis melo var. makuwa]